MLARNHIVAISIVTATIIAIAMLVPTVTAVVERTLPFLDKPSLISSFDRLEIYRWIIGI